MMEFAGKHFLLIVENEAVPFDRRVWLQAVTLKRAGASVSVICPIYGKDNKKNETLEEIDIFRYKTSFSDGSKSGYFKEYFSAFLKTFIIFHKVLLKKGKFDIIHAANPPDIFWPLAIYSRIFGSRFIFDEHDLAPETYLSRFENNSREGYITKFLKFNQRLSYKCAHAVISTNLTYENEAIRIYPQNKGKVFVVRNGPDLDKVVLYNSNPELKKGRKYLFGFIGVMAIQDGVDYIIKAVDYLVKEKQFKDFIVYLIGSGDDLPRLRNMVSELKLDDYIIFTGRIPDRPAFEILSTSDVCLSPDPYNPLNDKSTMTKVMEYMALAKPIVSFDLKEARYSAQDSALYVENNNPEAFAKGILRLLKDPIVSSEMGQKGRKRVLEHLSWKIQSKELLNTYQFALSKNQ
jgi:glycosyltransferase involved in cell wall biosynthesis